MTILSAFSMMFFVLGSSISVHAQDSNIDKSIQGVFEGYLETETGSAHRKIPLMVSLFLGDKLQDSAVGSGQSPLWDQGLILSSSFVLDEEAGPFLSHRTDFDPLSGKLFIGYRRQPGAADYGIYDFQIQSELVSPGRFEGEAFSGSRGRLGKIVLQQTSTTPTQLTTKNKYIGRYTGTWISQTSGAKSKAVLNLEPATLDITNPPSSEFQFTPGRVGSITMDDLQIPFTMIYLDYLGGTFSFVHTNMSGMTLTLQGMLDMNANVFNGNANSSLLGKTGTFTTKRAP